MATEITKRPRESEDLVAALQDQIDALHSQLKDLNRHDQSMQAHMRRLDDELQLAGRLQRDFLPKTLPDLGKLRAHALFRPAGHVSGDLYDLLRLDETHVGFFIVDAVGHGMPAALLTMYIKRALEVKDILATGYRILPPHEALQRVNDALVEKELSASTFATAIYGVVNVFSAEISFACAGHPSPVLLRDGHWQTLGGEGSLLGVFPGAQYEATSAQLRSGDRILIYSDGVELAFAQSHDAWRQRILDRITLPADQILREFAAELDHEARTKAPDVKDDLTMILLEVQ